MEYAIGTLRSELDEGAGARDEILDYYAGQPAAARADRDAKLLAQESDRVFEQDAEIGYRAASGACSNAKEQVVAVLEEGIRVNI